MIKVEMIDVYGFEAALRGMRNPMNSWHKADSYPAVDCGACGKIEREGMCSKEDRDCSGFECYAVGENDMSLMRKLYKAGPEHRKYLRMITVTMDITAPLYWLKEFDTYKVGTVANSCSTMHKIHAKEFTLDDFSLDHCDTLTKDLFIQHIIPTLNIHRKLFCGIDSGDRKGQKIDWYSMIQLLPSSYNQRRTVMLNYENVLTMIKQRSGHKLDEWNDFVAVLRDLPYIKELIEEV